MNNLQSTDLKRKEQTELRVEFEILLEADFIRLIRQSKRKDYYISRSAVLYSVSSKSITKMKPQLHDKGYLKYLINGVYEFEHRLVSEAFDPAFQPHLQINHIDKNRQNNHISNLEVCTAQENIFHQRVTNQLNDDKAYSITDLKQIQQDIKSNQIADLVKTITDNTYSDNIDSVTIKFKNQEKH
ncbi:HNH endonuclease [Macrococcus hajekii]|uniref:HNH endonuclease n=1 Tax=Macrococcus hajekii TaxID=198482 RepID=A0A4V6PPQ1_9STAP|nr:HNH endonuclease [Macrococcus hajekii]TDM03165.1 HNH endonuclease [Macrococcus hajekii]GGA96483.1 hypothetical protein GCM10007190_00690 [Macrococcus hajekii]